MDNAPTWGIFSGRFVLNLSEISFPCYSFIVFDGILYLHDIYTLYCCVLMNVVITTSNAPSLGNSCYKLQVIVILNQILAMLLSSGGDAKGGGKKPRTISGGMDVLNTARGETEFQHAAPVDVKLFPISGRV